MHDELYEQALDAITRLYGDKTVSKETTIESLELLIVEIEMMIDALRNVD